MGRIGMNWYKNNLIFLEEMLEKCSLSFALCRLVLSLDRAKIIVDKIRNK